jgi:ABC-2 type transport system permease protein
MSAIRYEWARVRGVRSTWAAAGVILLLGAGATWVASRTAGTLPDRPGETARLVAGGATVLGPPITVLAVAVAGVLSCSRDLRPPALLPVLLAMPRRTGPLVAKAATAAALAAFAGATSLAVGVAVACGTLGADARDLGLGTAPAARVLGAYVGCLVLSAVQGVAVGVVTRGGGAAAAATAALPLAVEPLVAQAAQVCLPEPYSGWSAYLPFTAADRMLAVSGGGPSPVAAAAALGAWTLGALLVALTTTRPPRVRDPRGRAG